MLKKNEGVNRALIIIKDVCVFNYKKHIIIYA